MEWFSGFEAFLCRFMPVSGSGAGHTAGGGPAGVEVRVGVVVEALEERKLLSCSLSGRW